MKKRIIILSIIILLISILSIMLFNNEENVLENNRIDRDKTYAIMVQNEDKTGYIESTSNTFPNDMTLNEELTNCVDESGTKVDNPFIYENGIITVRTSKKIYCYLYFDAKSGISSGSDLILNPTNGLNTTLEGGLYRYQGTSVDNYICFGTSDKPTCLNNLDAHMYRIIGIAEDGKIKLLKNSIINTIFTWCPSSDRYCAWTNSPIYSGINSSSFLTDTTYVPDGWSDKIETIHWKYGQNDNHNVSAAEMYSYDNSLSWGASAKIGLMYPHDYYYAYQSGGLNCSYSGSYSTCKLSWMFIGNCDSSRDISHEWLLGRMSTQYAYALSLQGDVSGFTSNSSPGQPVRPVFFLKSDIQFISGSGKADDPFIIS